MSRRHFHAAVPALLAAGGIALIVTSPAVAAETVTVDRMLEPSMKATDAFAYTDELAGARVRVHATYAADGKSLVTLQASRFTPGKAYAVHAHVNPCTATPSGSGGHYQHVSGTGPDHVNPDNEIWLDFTANDAGQGAARSTVAWQFEPQRRAQSVTIHDHATGARLACVTVPF